MRARVIFKLSAVQWRLLVSRGGRLRLLRAAEAGGAAVVGALVRSLEGRQ